MLRITSHLTADECLLQLEGCLAGAWVPELARSWQRATAARAGHVRVDLTEVCHVDDDGRALMAAMHRAGVGFIAAGFVVPEIIRDIARAAEGGQGS